LISSKEKLQEVLLEEGLPDFLSLVGFLVGQQLESSKPSPSSSSPSLPTKELAKLLGCSESKIYADIKKGRIRVLPGRPIRIPAGEVSRLTTPHFEDNTAKPKEELNGRKAPPAASKETPVNPSRNGRKARAKSSALPKTRNGPLPRRRSNRRFSPTVGTNQSIRNEGQND